MSARLSFFCKSVCLWLLAAAGAVPCFDNDNGCEDWAAKGECEKNPGFMKEACPESCKVCTPPPPIDEQDDPLLGRERAVMTTDYGEIIIGATALRVFYLCCPRLLTHAPHCPQASIQLSRRRPSRTSRNSSAWEDTIPTTSFAWIGALSLRCKGWTVACAQG